MAGGGRPEARGIGRGPGPRGRGGGGGALGQGRGVQSAPRQKAHDKQLGPIAKSLDRGRGRGRGGARIGGAGGKRRESGV